MAEGKKVLSQSGISLSDVYDVEGSRAGIERLDDAEVKAVHELGGTIFSERMGGIIKRRTTGALNQSTNFAQTISDFESDSITRITGISVIASLDRINFMSVCVLEPGGGLEFPIWAWDSATDPAISIRWDDSGAGAANEFLLRPLNAHNLPSFLFGTNQRRVVPQVIIRGVTDAFGAGTVTTIIQIYEAFADRGSGLSSFGLPVPSW